MFIFFICWLQVFPSASRKGAYVKARCFFNQRYIWKLMYDRNGFYINMKVHWNKAHSNPTTETDIADWKSGTICT